MDRFRAAFHKITRRDQYNLFSRHQDECETHIEVKLSDDTEAEEQEGGFQSFRPAPLHKGRRNTCYLVLGSLLIFCAGCLIGYISDQKHHLNHEAEAEAEAETSTLAAPAPGVQLDWNDVAQLLKQKLSGEAFDKTLSDFDRSGRSAGSPEDMSLANRVFDEFKALDMDPWTDVHYVQLQKPDSERPNRVLFGSDVFEPTGYLAYSPSGTVPGKLVYGNYGRREDLDVVRENGVDLNGSVLLLRIGKISFAEQVDNAARNGAAAVLLYPDPQDYKYEADTTLYGHVHLGSGDPYTPGFPSFNHTQFPPTSSSGLPRIPAQTVTANMATALLQGIDGPEPNASSTFTGGFKALTYRLGGSKNVTVEVNNVLVNTEIHNVFGVIKGFTDPDRYVVLGAQRDAWGQGYAKATVGSAVLLELAKAVRKMVEEDGFRPRRSLVFASWSAGEYGSVGATEWLEGYMTSVDRSVFTYINLDGVVTGLGGFVASASPLLYSVLESTMMEVPSPFDSGSLYSVMGGSGWQAKTLRPMSLDDPAYPFLASFGIPSISFHFISPNTEAYPYYGTDLDTKDHLDYRTSKQTGKMAALAAQLAGQIALRLTHDRLLRLDVSRYSGTLARAVARVYKRVYLLEQSGQLKDVSPSWLNRARGSFQRAATAISGAIKNTNLDDAEACRIINDKIMRVEQNLLSPYASPIDTPFRHLLLGRGNHTLASLADADDMQQLHTQLALATWTLQGCANAMAGDIWDLSDGL